jgi:heme/copper-type cytochrome/quinol oxidase subunit 2
MLDSWSKPSAKIASASAPSLASSLLYVLVGVGVTVAVVALLCVARSYRRRQAAQKGLYTFGSGVDELDGLDGDAIGVYTT